MGTEAMDAEINESEFCPQGKWLKGWISSTRDEIGMKCIMAFPAIPNTAEGIHTCKQVQVNFQPFTHLYITLMI